MSPVASLAPLFIQVALTFALLVRLGQLRIRLVRSGVVKVRDYAAGLSVWPPDVIRWSNAFSNQFELPVLFYLVTVLAVLTGNMSVGLLVLSWLFVVSRLLHALIYVTSNNVARRFFTYLAGMCALIAMWLLLLGTLVAGS